MLWILKNRFPHFWDAFWQERLVFLGAYCLLIPASLAAAIFCSTLFPSWNFLANLSSWGWIIACLSSLSLILFLSELLFLNRSTLLRIKKQFRGRYLEKLELYFGGILQEEAQLNKAIQQIKLINWVFSFLIFVNFWILFFLLYLFTIIFLWILGNVEFAFFEAALVLLLVFSISAIPIGIFYSKFKVKMEAIQCAFRDLLEDLSFSDKWKEKQDFSPPFGKSEFDYLSLENSNIAHLRFFELSHQTWGKIIFQNFSLTLPNNSCIGICANDLSAFQGMLDILKRRVDPLQGILKIYNQDFRNFSKKSIERHFRFVGSLDLFFPGSIEENLLIHQPFASINNAQISNTLEKCGLNHLRMRRKGAHHPLPEILTNLDKFRFRIARLLLLPEVKALYFHDPFRNLSPEEIREATHILKKIASDFQLVFFECYENKAAEESEYLFFFREEKNPVLSNFQNLKEIQPDFQSWLNSPKKRFSYRKLFLDFDLNKGSKRFSWVVENHDLADLWWENLWKNLAIPPAGSEQRFFGWRTEDQYQEMRVSALNRAINTINLHFKDRYQIKAQAFIGMNQDHLNEIHHHFEILMGQSWKPSPYLENLPINVHNAIRALNDLVHDYEYAIRTKSPPKGFHVVSGFQVRTLPAKQIPIPKNCFPLFTFENQSGALVTDYCQLGKTWSEVYEDKDTYIHKENISPLRFYSSSFICNFYHLPLKEAEERKQKIQNFILEKNRANNWDLDPKDPQNALGHVLLAKLEPVAANMPPTLEEFSNYSAIKKIALKEEGREIDFLFTSSGTTYEQLF
jgi:ABC-type polar amino acid transport system ATPase subunit